MKRTDQKQLLDDVLTDEADVGRNAAVLNQLLLLARRRRRIRRIRRVSGTLAVIAVIVAAFLFQPGPQKSETELTYTPDVPFSYETVTSFALLPSQLVSSRPLLPEQIILSSEAVVVVRTSDAGFLSLSDEELLELAKPKIAVLVRRGPQEAELVFVTPSGGSAEN